MIAISDKIYDMEMNKKYNVHIDIPEEVEDWTEEESKWLNWLNKKIEERDSKDEDEDSESQYIRNELITFVYNVLLYRNLKAPTCIDGFYRAPKVVKINKLMTQKGGLIPWHLEEIKCSGLYTIHPVWYVDPEIVTVRINELSEKQRRELNIPDLSPFTKQTVKVEDKVYNVYLENTNFVQAQIKYNSNWNAITSLDLSGGILEK